MAGVVLVAALTVSVPAFASAHGAAQRATKGSALFCPVATAAAGTPASGTARSAPATTAASKSRRGRRRRHSHHRAAPCIPPCRWLTAEPAGATGPTGVTDCEPPPVCRLAAAGPQPICPPTWCRAEGGHGDTTGPTGATPPCTPLPCPLAAPGGAPTGATGATPLCRPLPCPVPQGTPSGATTPAIVCPRPPICPLSSALHSSVCVPPCVVADPAGATAGVAVCPRIPSCPPPPATAVATAHAALYACPEVPGAGGAQRLSAGDRAAARPCSSPGCARRWRSRARGRR